MSRASAKGAANSKSYNAHRKAGGIFVDYFDNGKPIATDTNPDLEGNGLRKRKCQSLAPLALRPAKAPVPKSKSLIPAPLTPVRRVQKSRDCGRKRRPHLSPATPTRKPAHPVLSPPIIRASCPISSADPFVDKVTGPISVPRVDGIPVLETFRLLQEQEHELPTLKKVLMIDLRTGEAPGGMLKSTLSISALKFPGCAQTLFYLIRCHRTIDTVIFYDDVCGNRTFEMAILFHDFCCTQKYYIRVRVMTGGLDGYMGTAFSDRNCGGQMASLVEGLDLLYWVRHLRFLPL